MPSVDEYLEAYRLAHESFDVEASVALYRLPCAIVTNSQGWIVRDRADFATELGRIFEFYRWAGVTQLLLVDLETRAGGTGVALASLGWRFLDDEDQEVARLDVTYALSGDGAAPLITGVVVHNARLPREQIAETTLRRIDGLT